MKHAVILLFLMATCYSPPAVQVSDTSGQQEQIRRVQSDLAKIPESKESQIGPRDRATIFQAGDALGICSQSLKSMDQKLNVCASQVAECGAQYKNVSADLALCEAESSFFGDLWRDMKVLGLGIAIGVFLSLFGPLLLKFAAGIVGRAA